MLGEIVFTVIAIVGLAAFLKAWIRHHNLRQIINKIPGSHGIPFLGDALTLKSDSLGFFNQVYEHCVKHPEKGIIKIWMGPEPMAFVFSADTVEPFLNSTKHTIKAFTYEYLKPWLGDGLLNSKGKKWAERRRMITPTFHFQILEQFTTVFNENASVLVRLLDKKANGSEFIVQPFIYHCMLDSICETAMGIQIHAQEDVESDFVKKIYRESELVLHRMKFPWLWPERLFRLFPSGREDSACLKVLHDFSRKVIRERIKARDEAELTTPVTKSSEDENIYTSTKKRRLAFVDMLLSEKSLGEADIQEEVDTFMFEGHDTTASGMVWILYMLACNPEFQAKVQQEIDAVIGSEMRDVTMEDVQKLTFTDWFIKETFRLYPPVSWFGRTTTEPCTLGGYEIPEGTSVTLFTYALHRDPKYFPEPEKFDPDRWSDASAKQHPFCYIPFSAGARNCIGQRFAMLELKVILCHLVHHFTVAWSSKRDDLIPVVATILKQEYSVPIQLHRRHAEA